MADEPDTSNKAPGLMLERAARALCALDGNPENASLDGKPLWQDYLPEARAVFQAIREPSGEMLGDVHDTILYHVKGNELDTARLVWDRFVDVLLDVE